MTKPKRNLASVDDLPEDDLAKRMLDKKQAREQECGAEIQSATEKHNCQLVVRVKVGEQLIPVGQVVNLPTSVHVETK